MEAARPLVSIAIPSYNYARFIERSIRSAMAQTYDNLEIIVSDNGSTDDSVEIISRLAAIDGRIRFWVNDENVGPFGNLRILREASKGEYVVFLSADDILFPNHVSDAVNYYRTHPECDLRHTAFAIIDDQGEIPMVFGHPGHHGIRYISAREELAFALTADGHYMWPSIVFPRRVLDRLGPLATHVVAADIDYLFHANRDGLRIAFDGTPSVAFRRHSGGVSSRENHIQTGKHLHDWLTLYDESVIPETMSRLVGRRHTIVTMIESRVRPLQMYAPEQAAEIFAREEEFFNRLRAKAATIPDKLDASTAAYPRFSVILPTMSALAQLKRSLDSVLAQTASSWELIVVSNDGRNIEGILRSWIDPKQLVYVETLGTRNAAVARNVALRIARGETIAYLDEGDVWDPTYLESLGRVLDSSNADIVRTGATSAIYDTREFGPGQLLQRDPSLFAPAGSPYVDPYGLYAPLSAIAHRAFCREVVGLFNEGLPLFEDWQFVARLATHPHLKKVDISDVLVESANYRGLVGQTLGDRLPQLPSIYQAVSPTLTADPAALAERLNEIVGAANRFLPDKQNIEYVHALIRSISGYRPPQ
jgi:glycosyltransferase involved in cell wall biosynthesis